MSPETLALAALAAVLGLATVAAVGYAVALDARARGSDDVAALGLLAAVFALPVVPAYVFTRGRLGDRDPPTTRERRVRTVALAGLLTFATAAAVPVPDPVTQVLAALALFVPMLAAAHLLVGR